MSTPRKRNFVPAGPIPKGTATDHNKAPQPLVGDDTTKRATVGLEYMTYEQLEEFGREMDAIRQRVLDDLGQADADYIRKVIKVQRGCEVAGRVGMYLPFLPPVWLAAVGALSVSKILENMEIGHNIMHGQYDWMNDPHIQGQAWDWDNVAPGEDWRRTHNLDHHTYTNIHGKDKDIGYGLLRIDADQKWSPYYLGNLVYAFWLMVLFEWGVMLHGTEWDEFLEKMGRDQSELGKTARRRARKKAAKQALKDYVLFPALTGPFFATTIAGNFAANLVRNVWAFNIIFCGHFPAEVQSFHADDVENETRGQWYLRQLLGSANISGGKLFHIMSGNLSHQIEHHLFPDIPARRYPEMAADVRALCEKHGLPYNTGRMSRQLWSVFKQLARLSLPTKAPADVPDITPEGTKESVKVAA
ncbi:MAG TPA: acyl-CoA desaturase [Aeromicrobium sp.]|nr:acyl-CoA desaturase [Aeromicrobium sp.]